MALRSIEREVDRGGSGWSLAERIAAGVAAPASDELISRGLVGAGIDSGSRVVELDAGLGMACANASAGGVRSWTAVDEDPVAVAHLSRLLRRRAGRAVHAPASASGLPAGEHSAVVVIGALGIRYDEDARAVLEESMRLLAPAGRIVVIEPVLVDPSSRSRLELPLRTPQELRSLIDASGFATVGAFEGAFRHRSPGAAARVLGPRRALRLARQVTEPAVRRAATTVRQQLDAAAPVLRTGVVVGERPLILGMRRPRR